MKRILYLNFLLLLVALVVTVNLKNPQNVTLAYYFNLQWEGPIVLALTVVFIVGLLLGWLFMTLSVVKNKRVVSKTKRQLAKVEQEVENLRAMPIKDELSV